jgi:tRNA nucleotidyltransferase (CCA-adding enzyme)
MGIPRLIDAKQIPDDVLFVCRRMREAGFEAYLVGGSVRDLLLGRTLGDFDVATSARPEEILRVFGARFSVPTGLQHGTVTVLAGAPPRPVEVTTFRGEGAYLDGRHPSVVTFGATLAEDLSRRDFTMNAIAYEPQAGVVIDLHQGEQDIARRLVRTVGDPVQRFSEDGLRPMRAVRQATQLGFEVDAATLAAIPATLDVFRKVSAERIRDELLKLLLAPRPSRGIELMRQTGLLAEILPEVLAEVGCQQNRFHKHDVYQHSLATLDAVAVQPILRLAALLHDVGKPRTQTPQPDAPGEFGFFKHEYVGAEMAEAIAGRLRLSRAETELLIALVAQHMFFYTPEWSDGTVRRFVNRVQAERISLLFALREADIVSRGRGEDPECETRELRARIARVAAQDAVLRVKDLAVDGADVMRVLGVAPGPQVGRVLNRLLERVLDDPALNQKQTLERLIPELAAL